MIRATRLFCVAIGVCMTLGALSAHARSGSVLINKKPIRARLNALVKGSSLRLGKPLTRPSYGISARAFRKAKQTAQGFNGFNYGAGAKSYALSRGKGRSLVVTTARAYHYLAGGDAAVNHFVARDGRSGVVVGRGYINKGKITWTRSKNERGRNTPSERNAVR
jgi:hypothetical protein